jgi:hypothetical protein
MALQARVVGGRRRLLEGHQRFTHIIHRDPRAVPAWRPTKTLARVTRSGDVRLTASVHRVVAARLAMKTSVQKIIQSLTGRILPGRR